MVLLDTCITSSFDHFTPNLKTKDCLPFSQIVEGIEIAEHFKMRPSITPFMTPWLKGPCPLKLSKPLFNKITCTWTIFSAYLVFWPNGKRILKERNFFKV